MTSSCPARSAPVRPTCSGSRPAPATGWAGPRHPPPASPTRGAPLAPGIQTPQPNGITASLGFGFDAFGFPGRYLEEDPLTESLISSLVHSRGIVVSISANDGTRTFTNAAIGSSGGAA